MFRKKICGHNVAPLVVQNEGNWVKRQLVELEATVKGVVTKNRIKNENMQEHFISK